VVRHAHPEPLTDQERVLLIIKTLKECKEDTSFENVAKRFYFETGKKLEK